jgi:small multidrug resistance pump
MQCHARDAQGETMGPVTTFFCLAGAILTEVVGTIALAGSNSLTKPVPSVIAVVCFVAAFWLLSFPLRTMPTGIVYAIWSGMGIVLITAAAWVWSKQALDAPALIGMALITLGVVVINLFSKSEVPKIDVEAPGQTCVATKSSAAKCK